MLRTIVQKTITVFAITVLMNHGYVFADQTTADTPVTTASRAIELNTEDLNTASLRALKSKPYQTTRSSMKSQRYIKPASKHRVVRRTYNTAPPSLTSNPAVMRENDIRAIPDLQVLAQEVTVVPLQPRSAPTQQTPQDIDLPVPLMESGRYLGDVTASIMGSEVLVLIREITSLLEGSLNPEVLESIAQSDTGVPVPLDHFRATGITINWDPGLLELNVVLPLDGRPTNKIILGEFSEPINKTFEKPARFSTFVNIRTSTDFIHEGGDDTGLKAPFVDGTWAGRAFGAAYENNFSYDAEDGDFRRLSSRLIHDDVNRAFRAELGDVNTLSRSFQSNPRLAGVSVYKATRTLQPFRNIRPTGFQSFSLDQESEVQVLVNGRQVRRLNLAPGNYDLTNFPFVQGENNVQLIVEDRTGSRNIIQFDTFFDRSLFEKGYAEWGVSAGVRSILGDSSPEYFEDDFAATGFYRRGLSDTLTAGANAQFDDSSAMVGGEILKAFDFGLVALDFAASTNDASGEGYALDMEYTYSSPLKADADRYSWGVSGRVLSENFSPIGTARTNPTAYETRAFYSRTFKSIDTSVSLNGSYLWGRNDNEDRWLTRLSIGKRLTEKISLSTDLTYQEGAFGNDGLGARIQLTYRPGRRSTATASYDTFNERFAGSYQKRGDSRYGVWSVGVDGDRTPTDASINASGFLVGTRGDVGLSHRVLSDGDFNQVIGQVSSLRTANSFSFADGAFAFGRPVNGGFAILTPHKTLKNSRVGATSSVTGQPIFESRLFGKPLIGEIPNYTEYSLEYDVDDLPLGYDLGTGISNINAPLYAGYNIKIGSALNSTVIATALDPEGTPIAFTPGTLTSSDHPSIEPIEMFTNGKGRFGATGIGAGTWELRLDSKPYPVIIYFKIEEEPDSLIRLGTLKGEYQ